MCDVWSKPGPSHIARGAARVATKGPYCKKEFLKCVKLLGLDPQSQSLHTHTHTHTHT